MNGTAFVCLVVRSLVLGIVVMGCMLSSAWNNRSFAFQETNVQCEFGTDVHIPEFADGRIVSTFHSLSIYWRPNGRSPNTAAYVLFRERAAAQEVRRSLNFIYSADDDEYRGSVVHLRSGTEYEITLMLDDIEQKTVTVETWCEQLPIAETRYIPTDSAQTEPYLIRNVVGSPDGYIVYTAAPGSPNVLDGRYVASNIVIQDSSYVIVRGLTLKNAQQDAISLLTGDRLTHDIVIEQNVIENWGRISAVSGFGEWNYAIGTGNGKGVDFKRLIVQRNIIRNPRGDANSWTEYREDADCNSNGCHPKGPKGLYFVNTAGNHVIRYNEIGSTNGNYFDDGIGGARNFDLVGSVNRDTDIYGNIVTNVWDDAIEVEGADVNVRIWGNYIDNTFVAIAIAPVARGPAYIFRNIVYRVRRGPDRPYQTGVFIKNQTKNGYGQGHAFIFHNTVFRKDGIGGVNRGIYGTGSELINLTSRNNIIDARTDFFNTRPPGDTNDFDYDLYWGDLVGTTTPQEQHGIKSHAAYGNDPSRPYALADRAPGHNQGAEIPNFSDNAVEAPDMGAQERGAPPLAFGMNAQ